jgi:protein O-GlcNAc transferase
MTSANPTAAKDALRAALALQQRGDFAAAETAYRDLLDRFGPNPDAEHMLALTLHAAGRSDEALPWFERAEQSRAGAMLWNNHAAALLAVGRAREASDLARRATIAESHHAGAWLNLGLALNVEGDFDAAISALARAIELAPANAVARRAMARCQLNQGDADGAIATLRVIPDGDASTDLLRADAMVVLGKSNEALDIYDRVAAIDPGNRHAAVETAQLRIARGDCDAGLRILRNWLDAHPDDNAVASTYFVACNYSENMTPHAVLVEHRRFPLACKELPTSAERTGRASPSNALRIGWIKDGFGADLSAIFLEAVMRAFPRIAPDVEHVLYAVGGNRRASQQRAKWSASQHDASHLSDSRLIERIIDDRIDVLVDMMGHTTGNRSCVFAARAAPVQVGWLDAFYTSGLKTMDFLITDPWLSPPGAEKDFTERLLRIPHGRLAYQPPPIEGIDVEAAAQRRFVSLNRFSKLNDGVIDVWASILRELPDWALLLKARGCDDDLVAHFRARFARMGIDPTRIDIEGEGTYAQAMAAYDRASIALDPFPFSGCSTTCDALWMGLPVVTWPRETMASRQTAAWLEMAGKSEWIASDAASYVDIAIAVAGDETTRRAWRAEARDVLRPAITDSDRFAREFIDAIRAVAITPH